MLLRDVATSELTREDLARIRALMDEAFHGDFTDDDIAHGLGGHHWLIEHGDRILCHAAVVARVLEVDGSPVRTGYVEAVATLPARQRQGLGSQVMRAAGDHIGEAFELGALSTGAHGFYERLGWERWRGPTSVRMPDGTTRRTEDEDDGIMILRTARTPPLDLDAPISCEWRAGDVW